MHHSREKIEFARRESQCAAIALAAAKSQCLREPFKRWRAGAIGCARGATRHAMSRLFAVSGWLARFARRGSLPSMFAVKPNDERHPTSDGRDVTWVLPTCVALPSLPVNSPLLFLFLFLTKRAIKRENSPFSTFITVSERTRGSVRFVLDFENDDSYCA